MTGGHDFQGPQSRVLRKLLVALGIISIALRVGVWLVAARVVVWVTRLLIGVLLPLVERRIPVVVRTVGLMVKFAGIILRVRVQEETLKLKRDFEFVFGHPELVDELAVAPQPAASPSVMLAKLRPKADSHKDYRRRPPERPAVLPKLEAKAFVGQL